MGKPETASFRKLLIWLWVILLSPLVLLFLLITLVSAGMFGELPTFKELENPKSNLASEVYSSDLMVLGKYYHQNRSNVHYEDLSPNLINALKATEDIRFEKHSGVDIRGLFRVFFKTVVLQQDAGGGSTLTQQLAKNLFPRERLSKVGMLVRKLKEWVIAVKLERNYTKEEILAMYLNTVEYGSNAYGIKSAARTFFNKAPSSLAVQEAAVLVGLLKAPTYYSPVRNPDHALTRRNVVLGQMKKYSLLTPQQFDSLKALPLRLDYQPEDHNMGMATYFREYIRQELAAWCKEHKKADGTSYNLYTDGLKIYTTINSKMQRYAEDAVKEHLAEYQKLFFKHWKNRKKEPWTNQPEILTHAVHQSDQYLALKRAGMDEQQIQKIFNTPVPMTIYSWDGEKDTVLSPLDSVKYYSYFLQTGFMSMDPQTGFVKAWVGGINYKHFKYDHVKASKRQVGSTFKPFLYTLAMQEGYSPCFKVPNAQITFENDMGEKWTPENSDGKYGGMLSLKEALANSINTVSAYLIKQFGPEALINMARKMGITSRMDPYPSLCLGTPDVSVCEMVGAYSTFANKGVWTEPVYITRIEDKNGNVLQAFVPRKVEAIDEQTAYLMTNMLQGVTQFGTGARLYGKYKFRNPIAGKTGTTQNQSDAWFIGMVPDLVSGVWVGCEDRSVHFWSLDLGQGAHMAMPVWALYMQKIYADSALGVSKGSFEQPKEKLRVELDCKKYITPSATEDGSEW